MERVEGEVYINYPLLQRFTRCEVLKPATLAVLFLVITIALMGSLVIHGQTIKTNNAILWPTYKYTNTRTGFVPTTWNMTEAKDFTVMWNFTANLCITSEPAIADVNGDGIPEAVFDSCDGYLYVVSTKNGSMLWKFKTGGGFVNPVVADLNGDGKPEILSAGDRGILYCLSGKGKLLWSIDGGFYRGAPVVADFDGDGRLDVAMGSVDGYVYIRLGNSSIVKIKVGDFNPKTLDAADVDGDGLPEIVCVEGTYIHVIDYVNGGFKVYTGNIGHRLISPPALYDFDGDGIPEAVFTTQDNYLGIYNLREGRVTNIVKLDTYETASPPSVGSLWRNGPPFIVVGTMNGLFIYYPNLTLYKSFKSIKVYTSSPIIADVDGDGHYEILIGEENGQFDIIDPLLGNKTLNVLEWVYVTGGPIMGSASVADVNHDGIPEIFIGSRDYRLYMIEPVAPQSHSTGNTSLSTILTIPVNSTLSTTIHKKTSTLSSAHSVGLTPGVGKYKPSINWQLIAGAIIISIAIIFSAYIYTKD